MKTFALSLLDTAFRADFAIFEVHAAKVTVYLIFPEAQRFEGDAVQYGAETIESARDLWREFEAHGGSRVDHHSDDVQHALEDGWCRDGRCDHYTCTEGASVDNWVEPEPTRWDYNSEAYGPTAKDAHRFATDVDPDLR